MYKPTITVPKPNPNLFKKETQSFSEFVEQEGLADWERELERELYRAGSRENYYFRPSGPRQESKQEASKCPIGMPGCDGSCQDKSNPPSEPTCDGCKSREADLKALQKENDLMAATSDSLKNAEHGAKKARDEAILERNAFDQEADNLALELERAIDQRDRLMEQLMWSEDQLVAAWEQIEASKVPA